MGVLDKGSYLRKHCDTVGNVGQTLTLHWFRTTHFGINYLTLPGYTGQKYVPLELKEEQRFSYFMWNTGKYRKLSTIALVKL